MKELASLGQLQELVLTTTPLTDAGLTELARLSQLQTLNVSRTKITDAGLKELAGLKQLKTLRVEYTRVTDAGAAELKKAVPGCEVEGARPGEKAKEPEAGGQPGTPVQVVSLTSDEFKAECDKDLEGTFKKYYGQELQVTGPVHLLFLDLSKLPVLSFMPYNPPLLCHIANKEPWAKVVPGQTVTVKGKLGNGLEQCVVVSTGKSPAYTASAVELAEAYQADRDAAQKKYDYGYIYVEGEVQDKLAGRPCLPDAERECQGPHQRGIRLGKQIAG